MFNTSKLGDWSDLEFWTASLPAIEKALAERTILPPAHQTFRALELTQAAKTRVIILGQDPYPTPEHAHGLAFSAVDGIKPFPKSLSNIFKELNTDLNVKRTSPDLTTWAKQGVLLLNTSLSVEPHTAGAHMDIGWSDLTKEVITKLSQRPCAWVLWGKKAQSHTASLGTEHLKIETPHPSPLSAYRGFFGSRPFSKVNQWLMDRGDTPIDWAAL